MIFYDILLGITIVLLYAIPILTVVFFIVSLCRYLKAKKANKNAPGTFSDEQMRERKVTLIITSILASLFVAILFCLIGLVIGAIAYM